MPTIAEELRAEGRKEGFEEAWAEGRRQGRNIGVLRLLERRFGALPEETRARVLASKPSDSEFEALVGRVIDAPTLDAVFGTRH